MRSCRHSEAACGYRRSPPRANGLFPGNAATTRHDVQRSNNLFGPSALPASQITFAYNLTAFGISTAQEGCLYETMASLQLGPSHERPRDADSDAGMASATVHYLGRSPACRIGVAHPAMDLSWSSSGPRCQSNCSLASLTPHSYPTTCARVLCYGK